VVVFRGGGGLIAAAPSEHVLNFRKSLRLRRFTMNKLYNFGQEFSTVVGYGVFLAECSIKQATPLCWKNVTRFEIHQGYA
jgi:hypothetical protein